MLLNQGAGGSAKIAFCGVAAALSTVLMFLTGLIPVATYALPALSGLVSMVVVVELGVRWAWPVYGVTAVLSLLLAADKEAVTLFILFFGYYPILKAVLERLKKKAFVWALKFLVFNAAMAAGFFAAIFILGVPEESFTVFGIYLPWVFLIAGNGVFLLYDSVISGLVVTYYSRLHKQVSKWLKF